MANKKKKIIREYTERVGTLTPLETRALNNLQGVKIRGTEDIEAAISREQNNNKIEKLKERRLFGGFARKEYPGLFKQLIKKKFITEQFYNKYREFLSNSWARKIKGRIPQREDYDLLPKHIGVGMYMGVSPAELSGWMLSNSVANKWLAEMRRARSWINPAYYKMDTAFSGLNITVHGVRVPRLVTVFESDERIPDVKVVDWFIYKVKKDGAAIFEETRYYNTDKDKSLVASVSHVFGEINPEYIVNGVKTSVKKVMARVVDSRKTGLIETAEYENKLEHIEKYKTLVEKENKRLDKWARLEVIETLDDLMKWGNRLHNCIYTNYYQLFLNGEVLFILVHGAADETSVFDVQMSQWENGKDYVTQHRAKYNLSPLEDNQIAYEKFCEKAGVLCPKF